MPGLALILGDWVRDTPWMPKLYSRAQDKGFLRNLQDRGVLRVAAEPAAGFLARIGGKVDAVYLAPDARRQGLGRGLLGEVMAAEPLVQLWTFQANKPARASYRTLGFVETEQTTGTGNKEHLPDVRLEWRR